MALQCLGRRGHPTPCLNLCCSLTSSFYERRILTPQLPNWIKISFRYASLTLPFKIPPSKSSGSNFLSGSYCTSRGIPPTYQTRQACGLQFLVIAPSSPFATAPPDFLHMAWTSWPPSSFLNKSSSFRPWDLDLGIPSAWKAYLLS